MWSQLYDPFGSMAVSAAVAAIPVVVLLGGIGIFELRAHVAALFGLAAALAVAILAYGMPVSMAGLAAVHGAAFGLLPIGWIILNVIFLYQLTSEKGEFAVLQRSISAISEDRRLQVLFIAFCLGAFFEGAAGFGTPVAVTAAMLMGLGFRPLAASGLSLIANTAPVAFGALGTPIIALSAVTGLDLYELSAMVGRQLPFFSVIVPFWLITAFVGLRKTLEIWPPILIAGVSFAVPQYLVSNFHGPWLVDIIAAIVSMASLALFLRVWRPAKPMTAMPDRDTSEPANPGAAKTVPDSFGAIRRAWIPWLILSLFVFLWGTPQVRASLDDLWAVKVPVVGLHELVQKVPPVVAEPHLEAAVFNFNMLSATGTGILLAAVLRFVPGLSAGGSPARVWAHVVHRALLAADDLLHAGNRLRHALLGHRRHARFGPCQYRLAVSFLRHAYRLARCGAHRLGHGLERAVWRPAAGYGRATRAQSGADGLGQQLRRRDGKDDRCPVNRRRLYSHKVVWSRRFYSTFRVFPFGCARDPRRHPGHGPSLPVALDPSGSLDGNDKEAAMQRTRDWATAAPRRKRLGRFQLWPQ
jgi:lactate permease